VMANKMINELIGPGIRDESNGLHQIPMRAVQIGAGLANHADSLISTLDAGSKCLVVCDGITSDILGNHIAKAVGASPLVLEKPYADMETVTMIRQASSESDLIIAVGSGTINDLCKYASFLEHKPYTVFATALSMNGYGSANASISLNGHKKTLTAHLPQAIYMDTDILSAAPIRLTRAGFADLLCRSTAQADWLLSHLLLGTDYIQLPFDLLKPYEKDLSEHAANLNRGDKELLGVLAEALIISGFGMVIAQGSYPASQGEHMIAHTMEMVHGSNGSLHGEQISVTTQTMAALQHRMIAKMAEEKEWLTAKPYPEKDILRYFGETIGHECLEEMKKKSAAHLDIPQINRNILTKGDKILQQLQDVMLPEGHLQSVLATVGCVSHPEDIGWNSADYQAALCHTYASRSRFTFLDIAWHIGD